MDEYILSDETYDAMNKEYDLVLPLAKKALSGKPPFTLVKRESDSGNDDGIKGEYTLLYSAFSSIASSGYSALSRVMLKITELLYKEYKARFGREIERVKSSPSESDVYLSATRLHLAENSPLSAVILSAASLILH